MGLRNITLSAEEELIDRARKKADARKTTLNNEFRVWLAKYGEEAPLTVEDIDRILEPFSGVFDGHRFNREELNDRPLLVNRER
jgi:hypothetical protein